MLFTISWSFVVCRKLCFGLAALLWISTVDADPSGLTYQIEFKRDKLELLGTVCQENIHAKSFDLPAGAKWLERSFDNGTAEQLDCLSYRKVIRVNNSSKYFDRPMPVNTTVSSLDAILPCRNSLNSYRSTVKIKLPRGEQISMPGRRIGPTEFELLDRPCSWSSAVIFGQIIERTLTFGQSKVRVAIPGGELTQQHEKLLSWLNEGVKSLATAYGELPLPETQVLIFPVGENREAVPWGQAMRGGGDAVHLYVDETKSLSELNKDWVLVHELSHLLHPYMRGSDGWLSEGIASYYQNVLRARSGLLSAQKAWGKLDAGFRRGEKQFTPGVRLYENTRSLMRNRQYMRVYWSGAAIALIGDVELRRVSGGKLSLDILLKEISACCLPTTQRRWEAKALLQRFDEISGTQIFSQLYDNYVMHAEFPALSQVYENLGLQRDQEGLRFLTRGTALRDSIMN